MEPRNGCRLCMRDLPPGAANSRDWFRPEGFTALRVLTSQNPTSKLIAARDKRYPMPSTAASHSGSGFLSRSFPSRQNLIRQRKTLAGQKNAKGYTLRHPVDTRNGQGGETVRT